MNGEHLAARKLGAPFDEQDHMVNQILDRDPLIPSDIELVELFGYKYPPIEYYREFMNMDSNPLTKDYGIYLSDFRRVVEFDKLVKRRYYSIDDNSGRLQQHPLISTLERIQQSPRI